MPHCRIYSVRWRRQHPAVKMTHSASASHLGSEFDDFLYAPIGEDRNGMLLSVLSALARSDVDPWQEAARLAGLPVATARQRLASLITALPGKPSVYPDPAMIAARLVALLPSRARPDVPSRKTLPSAGAATNRRTVTFLYVDLYSHRAGCPMDRRKPSIFSAGRQRPSTGFQHRFTTGAPADLWPVTGHDRPRHRRQSRPRQCLAAPSEIG